MELVIDLDKIDDRATQKWLIDLLKEKHIDFETTQRRQTIEEYNEDLRQGEEDFKNGKFITAEDLKAKILKW